MASQPRGRTYNTADTFRRKHGNNQVAPGSIIKAQEEVKLDQAIQGWNLDVITDEFNLSQKQVKNLTDTLELMTINEVLALALALGPTEFVAGPLTNRNEPGSSRRPTRVIYLPRAGSRKIEWPNWPWRSTVHAEQAELHRTSAKEQSLLAALAPLVAGLRIWLTRRCRSSAIFAQS